MKHYSKIESCPISQDKNPVRYFSLGDLPLVNNLVDSYQESIDVAKYPINLIYFKESSLTCLDCVVDPTILFTNYFFKTSVNIPYLAHCEEMFHFLQKFLGDKNLKICDIGGNDGSLLRTFKRVSSVENYYLNIDPSLNLTKICQENGINAICDFFCIETAKKIDTKFDVVVSTNVFQHLADINSFVEGVKYLLNENGIWILEFPNWVHDMETNQFDQIYHEHIYYYSVTPLHKLFTKHGIKILNVSEHKIHGGTLRLTISKSDSQLLADDSTIEYLEIEKKYNLDYHIKWGEDVMNHIQKSKELLIELKKNGKKIYGFGAAAKGCVYLNVMGIDNKTVDFIIDDTDIKQNKFVPGTGIQIKGREHLEKFPPDYILILSHNFTSFIMDSLKDIYNGKYLIFLPEIKIYD